ncbi:MAG: DUF3011 domain-containing protein [Bdellovibrionota bacterium]
MKKLLITLAFVFGVFALSQAEAQHRPPGNHGGLVRDYVTCESNGFNYNECYSPNVRRIERARLVQQHSKTACRQGRNWGTTRRSVWVDQGCRATIEVIGRR